MAMGALEVLLAMGVVAVPVGVLGGIVVWAIKYAKKRTAAWAAIAQRLGLHHSNNQIYGHLDGQAVRLFTETRGSGKNQRTYTVAAGLVVPGLDLGLAVYAHGWMSSLGEWMGMTDIIIGDPSFDGSFVVKGDEPHRVQALLSHAGLRSALHEVLRSRFVFTVRDEGFRVECSGFTADMQWMEWALRASAQIARHLGEARATVPCASVLTPHRDTWVQFAQATGLSGMDTPLCMSGRYQGRSIAAYAVRSAAMTYGVEVLVRFDQPLGLDLFVRPQGALDSIGALFGGQDHQVGDAEFDRRFVVKATSPANLSRIFDREVSARMLALLGRVGSIQVRDDGVTLRSPRFSPDPAEVPKLVAEVRTFSDRIADNIAQLSAAPAGPYR